MAYEHKDNSFTLFKNNKKTDESHADYTGSGLVFGKEVWVNARLKTAKSGVKFMYCTIKPKDADKAQLKAAVPPVPQPKPAADDDDVPF